MSHPAPGAPLGPRSLLWQIAGDWRSMLPGPSAGILQLMWPHLGKGVEEHSAFFTEPSDRILRSVPQIWATIFAEDADDRGRDIRDLHRGIKGTDEHGARYHALDPDTFWWAHATFTWEMFETVANWDRRSLSPRHQERLYQESVTWYRRYGVSNRPVPADVAAFRARFEEICEHELELTATAARAIEIALSARLDQPGLPAPVARLLGPVGRVVVIGGLPAVVRRRFDIPWSTADAATFEAVRLAVQGVGTVVPQALTRGPFLASVRGMKGRARPHPAAAAA